MQEYAICFESALQASCSAPPKGRLGQSYVVPSSRSVPSSMLLPSKVATKGWGASVIHSSQCLYIRSFMMMPFDSARSG